MNVRFPLISTHPQRTFSVLVIRLDLRSQKFPEKSSIMSSCQMNWLKQQLSQCFAYDLIILVSSVNWIGDPNGQQHGWAQFSSDRQTVANSIDANGCTDKLILVAGDAHMLAFDDGANSNYASTGSSNSKGFPVVRYANVFFTLVLDVLLLQVQSAPLWRPGSVKGGPYSHGCSASTMAFSAFTQFEVSFISPQSMCVSIAGMRVLQHKGSVTTDYTWTGCPPFRSVIVQVLALLPQFFCFLLTNSTLAGAKQALSVPLNLARCLSFSPYAAPQQLSHSIYS
jgi:hypothetical protein